MGWNAIAHSSPGSSHKQNGIPCQDFAAFEIFESILIGAVSDGAGSAKHSEIGSKLAVETALAYLKPRCIEISKKNPSLEKVCSEESARNLFSRTTSCVIENLRQEAINQNYSFKDLSCTLLLFVATPNWLAAMQIGDGFIVTKAFNHDYKLLFPPSKGEYINETIFVTSESALDQILVRVIPVQQFVFASTDGLERLALNVAESIPFAPFFKPFEDGMKQNPEEEEKSLRDWLDSKDVNARTDDDKTALICLYSIESPVELDKDDINIQTPDCEPQPTMASLPTAQKTKKSGLLHFALSASRLILDIKGINQNSKQLFFELGGIIGIIVGIFCHYIYNTSYFLAKGGSPTSPKFIITLIFIVLLLVLLLLILMFLGWRNFLKKEKKSFPANFSFLKMLSLKLILGVFIGWVVYYFIYLLFS